jgi:hypothetical protein
MIYIIISFRSSVTTGGSLMYLIKTNWCELVNSKKDEYNSIYPKLVDCI